MVDVTRIQLKMIAESVALQLNVCRVMKWPFPVLAAIEMEALRKCLPYDYAAWCEQR